MLRKNINYGQETSLHCLEPVKNQIENLDECSVGY
jgi:hypothetical protein